MPFANRTDKNQAEIVAALRQFGASVVILTAVKHGCPDLLVGVRGTIFLLEVKTAKGRLTMDEKRFGWNWAGRPVAIVRSVKEALAAVGIFVVSGTDPEGEVIDNGK